jgi:hypothetical protein
MSEMVSFRRLIWLMPAVFAVHIVEEYGAGFPAWVSSMFGQPMAGPTFLVNNAAFMVILLGLTFWASARPSAVSAFFLLSWASGNLFWNFVFHLATTVVFDRFSPGLVTATLLYLPVSVAVAWSALAQRVLPVAAFIAATAIGATLMLLVIWGGLYHFVT